MVRAVSLALVLVFAAVPANAQSAAQCAVRGSPCHVDTRLRMAGIENNQDAKDFLKELKAAARRDDRQTLAGLIAYPVTVFGEEKSTTYKTPEALLAEFDAVFTPRVLSAIKRARYKSLFVRDQGAMIGNGEIWFDGWQGAVLIKSINAG